ncbi:hypothetical protein ACQQ2N_09745 [Dokdonella sp. MW10]|uniref:hypothetical protein n=1 Tax=Dokdonella sp. MW10 TaxID=2992926 RepID=UPI003F80EFD1
MPLADVAVRAIALCSLLAFTAPPPAAIAAVDATASLTDVPFAPDPGFPLTSRRDIIVGGTGSGATAVAELAAGGDIVLGGVVSGAVVLQRVTGAGLRGTWPVTGEPNPGLLRHASAEGLAFRSVTDIAVLGGRIYVLANRQRSTSVTTNDVYVLVFRLDGTFLSSHLAMGDFRDEYGAGLAAYQTFPLGGGTVTWVSVVGHRVLDSVESNPFLTRARLEGDTLVRDTSIGDTNGYVQIPVPGGLCAPYNEACSMEVSRITTKPTPTIGAAPLLYVAGAIRVNGENWDYGLLCIGAGGTPCTGFGNGGFVRRSFDNGGSLVDRATGVAVRRSGTFGAYTYTVYLTGNVARRCQAGIGAVAFDGDDGSVALGFGLLGRVLVGGHDGGAGTTPVCFLNDGPDVTEGAALSGGRLFIGGARVYRDFGGTSHSDLQTLVLDAASGTVVDPLRSHAVVYPDGDATPELDAAVRSVGTDAAGRVLVGGQSVTPTSPYPSAFVSGRFVQDRIFGNGFE